MKINKFNKKVINNLIVGSFLFGSSSSIITQVQATQRPPMAKQNQYDRKATERLKQLYLESETPLSKSTVDQCIKLVRDENADPNVEVGDLTLLEAALLCHFRYAVEVFIEKGADIYRIANKQVVNEKKYGRTLLHLAVYPPQKVQKLLAQHSQKKITQHKQKKISNAEQGNKKIKILYPLKERKFMGKSIGGRKPSRRNYMIFLSMII
jgi:hypothetical protein